MRTNLLKDVSWNQAKSIYESSFRIRDDDLPSSYRSRVGIRSQGWYGLLNTYWGDDWETYTNYAVAKLDIETTAPVGSKRPNDWGLFDMLGNVWEWVEDDYDEDAYKSREGVTRDPLVKFGGEYRVLRGGSFVNNYNLVRCALPRQVQSLHP